MAAIRRDRMPCIKGLKYFIKLIGKYSLGLIRSAFMTLPYFGKKILRNFVDIKRDTISRLLLVYFGINISFQATGFNFQVWFVITKQFSCVVMAVYRMSNYISATTSRQSRGSGFSQCMCIESRMD